MITTKDRVSVLVDDTISKKQVIRILLAKLPCALLEDVAPFADMACAGRESVTVGELLLNCFANTNVPFTTTG